MATATVTLTGVGGGVLRDVMAGVMPSIFVRHVYALASVLGAAVCSLLWHVNSALAMVLGAGVVVLIRALAIHYHWKLPRIKNPDKVGIK